MKLAPCGKAAFTRLAVPAAYYFGLVFAAGFILGAIRVPFLVPRLGERVAELIEAPIMLGVIYFAGCHTVRRYSPGISACGWVVVGMTALTLLLAVEAGLVVALQGRSVGEYVASRDPVSGGVYLASLLVYAAMPGVCARWRYRRSHGRGR
jgi:hypothetical protein